MKDKGNEIKNRPVIASDTIKTNDMFQNRSMMVTDIIKNQDKLSKQLLEYFEKNFDVKLEKIKKKYSKQ